MSAGCMAGAAIVMALPFWCDSDKLQFFALSWLMMAGI